MPNLLQEALVLIDTNGIDLEIISRNLSNHLISIRDGKFNPKNKTFKIGRILPSIKRAKDRAIIENLIPVNLSYNL
jgi:hypothetical protein